MTILTFLLSKMKFSESATSYIPYTSVNRVNFLLTFVLHSTLECVEPQPLYALTFLSKIDT